MNTFPLPKIIYNKSLIFSPHAILLGMLFHDQAFAAYNLTSEEELSKLYIPLGRNKLPLHLNRELDDIPVLRQAERTPNGWAISPTEPLSYSTLLPWIRKLGQITGFASIVIFLKHYLSRRITVDTQAVVRGLQPQNALMRAACTMSRSIDHRRPQRLTPEESASVNGHPTIRSLLEEQEKLKRNLPNATKHPKYKELNSKIN